MFIAAENRESISSRPSDTPWSPEQNARYAAGRAATVAATIARCPDQADLIRASEARRVAAARKPTPATFTLASPNWMASFKVDGDTVTHTRTNGSRPYPEQSTVLAIGAARELWAELTDAGYWRW